MDILDGRFNQAVQVILEHEGGYSDDPDDPGGETNFGIIQRELDTCYQKLELPAYVKNLTVDQAKIYYKSEWWDKYGFNTINSDYIATKVFDMAVNVGAHEAATLVQRAINYCGINLAIDGEFGGLTYGAINLICLHGDEANLKSELKDEQKWFYEHLVEEKPQLKKFLDGWINRAHY